MATRAAVPKTRNGGGRTKLHAPTKLSLACGQAKPEGFFGIDYTKADGVDLVHDLNEFPWPIKSGVVEEIQCSHYVEHIPHWRPGFTKDGWWMFFDEVYRICKPDAICSFVHPYCMSVRADWDPTHERRIHENTWYYLNAEWRKVQMLDHYPTEVNFEVELIEGLGVAEAVQARHHEAQAYAREHYWNVIADLHARLKVLK